MVSDCAIAVATCASASHHPAMTNQMPFMIAEPGPAPGLGSTVLPKGHST